MKKYKRIYIEITNVCNLKCPFCSETKRTAEFMQFDHFRHILEQISPFTDYVFFHVKGEPLLHPQIGQFLDLCDEYGLMVNLTTNGTLIRDASELLLMKPALRQINFSLHSFDANNSNQNLDEYFSLILAFIDQALKRSTTIISLRLWNLGQHDGLSYKTRKNLDVLSTIEAAFKLPYKIEEIGNSNNGIKIAERVYLSQDSEFEWPTLEERRDLHQEENQRGFCHALKSQIAILVDGTVVPCCLDGNGNISLGNIHTTHFSDIISGERAENIRGGFSNNYVVEELCKSCSYRKRFEKTSEHSFSKTT